MNLFLSRLIILISADQKKKKGFTTLEVIAGAIAIFAFLLGALQAMVLGTVVRVRSLQEAEAVNWIEEDIANIKFEAFLLDIDNTATGYPDNIEYATNDASCGSYGNRFRTTITDGTGTLYRGTNLSSPTATSTAPGNASDVYTSTNFGKDLHYYRIYDESGNKLIVYWQVWDEGDTIDLTNNPDLNGDASVSDSDDQSLAIISTEILPYAALSC